MNERPPKELVLGAILKEIRQSESSRPEWVVEGIGPASFRTHFLRLDTGIDLDLSVGGVTAAIRPPITRAGEVGGLRLGCVLGRRIIGLALDDCGAPLVVLEGGVFLKDVVDFDGNVLLVERIATTYSRDELAQFRDYWSGRGGRVPRIGRRRTTGRRGR